MSYLTSTLVTAAIAGSAGYCCHVNKPSEKSFDNYFGKFLNTKLGNKRTGRWKIFNKVTNKASKQISTRQLHDFIVCRVAIVKFNCMDDPLVFVGAFKKWVCLNEIQDI